MLTKISMKVNGKMTVDKVKGHSHRTVNLPSHYILVHGFKTKSMAREYKYTKMVESMMDNGKMIRKMGMEYKHLKMERSMMESLKMI